jgi:FkbM family methyltransferase
MVKDAAYSLLNVLTLGRGITRSVGGFELRLPARYFRYYPSDYEAQNIGFVNHTVKAGMTVLDIGAHIGLFASIFGQKVGPSGKVFSFEPTPSTFKILKETVRINNLEQVVTPIQKAVSDKSGKTVFYISEIEAHNSNSLANNKRDYCQEKAVDVDLISVDDLVKQQQLKKVDFIKIDAEGAEYAVLLGADQTIREHKPAILLALHPLFLVNFGVTLDQIWDHVSKLGYEVKFENRAMPREEFISCTGIFDVFLIRP